ncbi:GDSL esterase/lipase At5g03980 [Beta vulgaris subsp. vulgaris]|uniref:GDSL esterase/lipase At5g03980 n=1 Tax=Beta vulgaris subsp. vulgaris TaxID=3555 RepID=UPI002546CE0B|nr:GDSL esterase/lipase At5g03980 [Beta vulgaris subsp. vulgaris]
MLSKSIKPSSLINYSYEFLRPITNNNMATSYNFLPLILFLSSFLLLPATATATAAAVHNNIPDSEKLSFDQVYQFGDSLSDTGNLVLENPVGAHTFANFPYGVSIHHPTGRCSDGLLIIDYFAKYFHLPLLKPYLNKQANSTHGLNFAVAGSTALDTATLASKNILSPVTSSSLSVQLNWFKSHLESTCGSGCKNKLHKSVFFIETGGNDYNYALLQRKTLKEVKDMVPQVVGAIKAAVEQVVSLGATRVVVPGNFPIGCLPIYLATFGTKDPNQYDDLKCLKGLNAFAKFHNDELKQAIRELQAEYFDKNVAVIYGDFYSGLRRILYNADAFGFKKDEVHKACCGSGNNAYNFDLMKMCGNKGVPVCADPSRLVSWDGIHLTQRAYMRMAQGLFQQIVPQILQVV